MKESNTEFLNIQLANINLKVGESVHYSAVTPKYFKNNWSLATDSVDHR